jgi:hypothetical protein
MRIVIWLLIAVGFLLLPGGAGLYLSTGNLFAFLVETYGIEALDRQTIEDLDATSRLGSIIGWIGLGALAVGVGVAVDRRRRYGPALVDGTGTGAEIRGIMRILMWMAVVGGSVSFLGGLALLVGGTHTVAWLLRFGVELDMAQLAARDMSQGGPAWLLLAAVAFAVALVIRGIVALVPQRPDI